jgi:hypothetical protein
VQVHYNAIAGYTTFESFMWSVPYTPHGPVHQIMGGTFGCEVRKCSLSFSPFSSNPQKRGFFDQNLLLMQCLMPSLCVSDA